MNDSFKGIWIPVELIKEDLTWTKRVLLAEISQLEILDKGCVANNLHFSDKFSISCQGVSKALNQLADDGYIVIDNAQTKRNFGRKITINYRKSDSGFTINHRKSGINCGLETKEKKPKKKPKTMQKGILFKDFYDQYPKKVDKANCEKKWKRLSLANQKKAIAGIASFVHGKESQFISSPTVYINGKRWEDEESVTGFSDGAMQGTEGCL